MIKIHGKEYRTVVERVNDLHTQHSQLKIETEIIPSKEGTFICKATITIADRGRYTGHAMEVEGSSQINRTSALENCETSAIGRALAAAGYGGTEYASANEVQNAVNQQNSEKKKTSGVVTPVAKATSTGSTPKTSQPQGSFRGVIQEDLTTKIGVAKKMNKQLLTDLSKDLKNLKGGQ